MTDASTTASDLEGRGGRSRGEQDPAGTFYRAGGRNRFTAREAIVLAVSTPVEQYVRVTLGGPNFHDFTSSGPADHVRVFFPDPTTGVLIAPRAAGPDEDGIIRPDAPTFARDFTPMNPRTNPDTGERTVDIDILLHADPGPAAAWGADAQVGDRLVVVGPRGSKAAPQNASRVVCVVDGTALPSTARWIAEVASTTQVEVLFDGDGDLEWVRTYLRSHAGRLAEVVAAGPDLAEAVRTVGVDASTYVFAAGEASRLIPLRRYLRQELALAAEQFTLSGYWKRGQAAFDHHAPIDPEDPAS